MKITELLIGERSLTKDFSLSFIIIVLLSSILVFSGSSVALVKIQNNKFKQESLKIFQEFKRFIVQPLWYYDDEEIASICKTFLSGCIPAKIIISSEDNRPLYTFGNLNNKGEILEAFSEDLFFKSKKIGKVDFYTRKANYLKSNKIYLFTTIIAIALISVFISLATWKLIHTYIGRPLEKLHIWIDHIKKGDYKNIYIDFPQREIQDVAQHFSKMVVNVKNREQELQENEEKYRLLAENVRDVIWTADLNLNMMYVSPSVYAFRGYTAEEVISQKVEERLTPGSLKAATKVLAEELKKESRKDRHKFRTKTLELESRCKDGSTRWSETSLSFIRDTEEKPIGILGVSRDITDRKRADKERLSLQTQLQQAQKMESIGTLAGGIAHDFNNILGAIIGYSEIIKYSKLPEVSELQYDLDQVLNAANRAKDLVQQILAFSRQVEQEKKPILIVPVIKEALKLLRASLPTTIEMRRNIQKIDSKILGDPSQIHQIIMNLCTNAGHAMQKSGGVLEVRVEEIQVEPRRAEKLQDLSPGSYVRLTVSDTGQGISPDNMDRIFNPYFTTKEKGEGTGLGLAVVHGIVKSHGGEITVDSQVAKGTKFQIYLPMIDKRISNKADRKEPLPTGHENILFVDDEKALVQIGEQVLQGLGYEVETRTSSLEALELFRANPHRFDLVVTDMTMPNMTGIQLAQEFVRIRPEIPIILCTGFSEQVSADLINEAGVKDLLMKPFSTREIALSAKKVLTSEIDSNPNSALPN